MNSGFTILAGLLAAAALIDVRYRRVPNVLVLIGIIAAFALRPLAVLAPEIFGGSGNNIGPLAAVGGLAVGFALMAPLYALRAMGAGDVKLMMMVGSFLGPIQTIGVVVLTFAAGGVLAIIMTLWQRSFRQLTLNLRFMLTTSAINAAGGMSPKFEPLQQTAGRMPYAVAIAAGTLLQLFLVRSGGWALS